MRSLNNCLAWFIGGLFLCLAVEASSQAHEAASRYADAAYDAYAQGDWAQAVSLFEQAIEHDPHPILLFNRARALEEAKRLPSALMAYRELELHSDIPRVVEASSERRQVIEATLLEQGYNPLTVTDRNYLIPLPFLIHTGSSNAIVYVNGRASGRGAQVLIRQPAGEHQLFIEAEGYYPFQHTITISEEHREIYVELEARTSLAEYVAPSPGLLSIVGPTAGMAIYIDGMQHSRQTPAHELVLPAGEYDILVRHPFYDDFHARVAIQAGEEFRLIATNHPLTSASHRTLSKRQRAGNVLMITGGSILGVAAITGSIAAVQSRRYNRFREDPDRGSLRDRARSYATGTDALLVGGSLFLGAGLVMRLVPTKRTHEVIHYQERMLELSPGVDASPLGFTIRYRH